MIDNMLYCKGTSIRQQPEFGTLQHYRKAHGSLSFGLKIVITSYEEFEFKKTINANFKVFKVSPSSNRAK